jgi:alpha-amylase/alpha-mannosidase (GH57 family)
MSANPNASQQQQLILYWHFHQPDYRDPQSRQPLMPWVRLHGLKDYWGMAALLAEFPEVKCSFNFVPSLLEQIEDCAGDGPVDEYEKLARQPVNSWKPAQRVRALDIFFHAHWDRLVRGFPRYGQLLDMRRPWERPAEEALGDFNEGDLRDLAVWGTLAWYHPLAVERNPRLAELVARGRDFSEEEKLFVLDYQKVILNQIIPAFSQLADRGQIEITSSPQYHPILPLLADMSSVRMAMPGAKLPQHWKPIPEDAAHQLARARQSHQQRFGSGPQGCWPSEGSLSEKAAELICAAGFAWASSDEDILAYSLGRGMERSELYRPYCFTTPAGKLDLLFRDRGLSDTIGFVYHGWDDQQAAAANFVERASAAPGPVVTAILDGENAWEYYPGGGGPFLRALYARLAESGSSGGLRSALPSEVFKQHQPIELPQLWAGSWINHDFYIWAGHQDDRQGWDYLFRVRADLKTFSREKEHNPENLARAWESLYAAEGSDWFWWYGDDHNSGNDGAFDQIFRLHLKNVYRALGHPWPDFLEIPITGEHGPLAASSPRELVEVTLNGRTDKSEWDRAGCLRTTAGAMDRSRVPLLNRLFFGAGSQDLFLRLDFSESRRAEIENLKISVDFQSPGPAGWQISRITSGTVCATLKGERTGKAVWDHVLELSIPRSILNLESGATCAFSVNLHPGNCPPERVPQSGLVRFQVP